MRNWKPILLGILLVPCLVIAWKYGVDFVNLHFAARLVAAHEWTRVYANNGVGRYFYGPLSLVLIDPLGAMPFERAKIIWNGLQTASFAVFWLLLFRLYPTLRGRDVKWGWLLIFIIAINPIHNNFQSGNVQLMLMALLLVCEILIETDNAFSGFLGGACVAIVSAIKVFPLFIAAFYFITRGKAVRAGVFVGFVVAAALPFAYFGAAPAWTLTQDFLRTLGTYNQENSFTRTEDLLCLPALLARLSPQLDGTPLARVILGAVAAGFLVFAWSRRRHVRAGSRSGVHLWALALAVMTLLNPSTRPHYFVFYVPAFCSILETLYAEGIRPIETVLMCAAAALIALTAQGVLGKPLNDRLELLSIPTYGALALVVALMITVLRRRELYLPRHL